MSKKKFKLIKDLPDLPSGAIFKEDGLSNFYEAKRKNGDGHWRYAFDEDGLKRNQGWFTEI